MNWQSIGLAKVERHSQPSVSLNSPPVCSGNCVSEDLLLVVQGLCSAPLNASVIGLNHLPKHIDCNLSYVCSSDAECKVIHTIISHHTCLLSSTSYGDKPNVLPSRCNPSYNQQQSFSSLTLWATLTAVPSIGQNVSAPFGSDIRSTVRVRLTWTIQQVCPAKVNRLDSRRTGMIHSDCVQASSAQSEQLVPPWIICNQ